MPPPSHIRTSPKGESGFRQMVLKSESVCCCLERTRPTLPQGDPRNRSRQTNVAGAFLVRQAERVRGRRVVLIDDVFTSGATMRQCARQLLDVGALEVAALVACRS